MLAEVRQSKFGKGLFAVQDLKPGTRICSITGCELNFQETLALKEKESHAVQIDFDRYVYCEPPFLFTNHSCLPNCGVHQGRILFALRAIRANEELFWDYSTSMLERHWSMPCHCGEPLCRKIITDFDLLPSYLQRKYLELHIVFPFIVQFVQQAEAKTA